MFYESCQLFRARKQQQERGGKKISNAYYSWCEMGFIPIPSIVRIYLWNVFHHSWIGWSHDIISPTFSSISYEYDTTMRCNGLTVLSCVGLVSGITTRLGQRKRRRVGKFISVPSASSPRSVSLSLSLYSLL